MTVYDLSFEDDHTELYNLLLNPVGIADPTKVENQVTFTCHMKRGGLDFREEAFFELVQFVGYFRKFNNQFQLVLCTQNVNP